MIKVFRGFFFLFKCTNLKSLSFYNSKMICFFSVSILLIFFSENLLSISIDMKKNTIAQIYYKSVEKYRYSTFQKTLILNHLDSVWYEDKNCLKTIKCKSLKVQVDPQVCCALPQSSNLCFSKRTNLINRESCGLLLSYCGWEMEFFYLYYR